MNPFSVRIRAFTLACALAAAAALAGCGPRDAQRVVNVKDFGTGAVDDPKSDCVDDEREEDDEIAYVLDKVVKDNEKIDAISCPGDDDFFHVFAKGRLSATITWNPAEGDLRIDVLDPDGAVMTFTSGTDRTERTAGRAVVQRLGAQGNYYLRVRNRAGTRVPYRVDFGPVAESK